MSRSVHGHEILEHIISVGGTLGVSVLRETATKVHGADAAYFTCSAQGMSFDELLKFLAQRNKVAIVDDTITVFVENMCRDGHHH